MNTFKQKALLSALAGAGALAMAGAANAVYINGDGLGQALVYPYYTVRAGTNTLLSVVNTTDNPKAVKIEGKNSQEVPDFNLFLSPKDVWTAAVVNVEPETVGTDYTVMPAVALVTSDPDCSNAETLVTAAVPMTKLDRIREGYVELIEMAQNKATQATRMLAHHERPIIRLT